MVGKKIIEQLARTKKTWLAKGRKKNMRAYAVIVKNPKEKVNNGYMLEGKTLKEIKAKATRYIKPPRMGSYMLILCSDYDEDGYLKYDICYRRFGKWHNIYPGDKLEPEDYLWN